MALLIFGKKSCKLFEWSQEFCKMFEYPFEAKEVDAETTFFINDNKIEWAAAKEAIYKESF